MNAEITRIRLDRLRDHPMNANAMPKAMLAKLKRHIAKSGRYPPLIVRPMPGEPGAYQLIDGHHRRIVLGELNHADAACVVWDLDDEQTLTLLATVNRLEGSDDPKRRAAIIGQLETMGERAAGELARWLPESADQVRRLGQLNAPPPRPLPARPLREMRTSLTFHFTVADRARVIEALEAIDRQLETALLRLIDSQANPKEGREEC
jgi:hypothetical protein